MRDLWDDLFPDPGTRDRWRAAFGPDGHATASLFEDHFTDPTLAARWAAATPIAELAAYLHANGITPDEDQIDSALWAARDENAAARTAGARRYRANLTRAGLMIVHPHLAREDRDAILAVGLTLTDVDHMIATGTYDRGALTLTLALQ